MTGGIVVRNNRNREEGSHVTRTSLPASFAWRSWSKNHIESQIVEQASSPAYNDGATRLA